MLSMYAADNLLFEQVESSDFFISIGSTYYFLHVKDHHQIVNADFISEFYDITSCNGEITF